MFLFCKVGVFHSHSVDQDTEAMKSSVPPLWLHGLFLMKEWNKFEIQVISRVALHSRYTSMSLDFKIESCKSHKT